MRILQRVVLLIGTVMFVFLGVSVDFLQKEGKLRNQWETLIMEEFLRKLSVTEICTVADYQQLYTSLECGRVINGIEIEEYRKEEDMQGNRYYYLVSWKEREPELFTEGCCRFQNGSIVSIKIKRLNETGIPNKSYWDIITGKENK